MLGFLSIQVGIHSSNVSRTVPTTPGIKVITKLDVAHPLPQYLQPLLAFMPKASWINYSVNMPSYFLAWGKVWALDRMRLGIFYRTGVYLIPCIIFPVMSSDIEMELLINPAD